MKETRMQTPEEVRIKELELALDTILNGTMIDSKNHNDDGLMDFDRRRPAGIEDLRRWRLIALKVLNKYK